jgi:hypothetical protein
LKSDPIDPKKKEILQKVQSQKEYAAKVKEDITIEIDEKKKE